VSRNPPSACDDRDDDIHDRTHGVEPKAEAQDLHRRGACVGIDELRQEREEEERDLGVEDIHQHGRAK